MLIGIFGCWLPGARETASIALVVMRPGLAAFAFEDYPCIHLEISVSDTILDMWEPILQLPPDQISHFVGSIVQYFANIARVA